MALKGNGRCAALGDKEWSGGLGAHALALQTGREGAEVWVWREAMYALGRRRGSWRKPPVRELEPKPCQGSDLTH